MPAVKLDIVSRMFGLDTSTLLFASASSRGAYAAIFFISLASRRSEGYLAHWGTSILLSMVGLVITYTATEQPFLHPLRGCLVYAVYAGSLTLCWSGLRRFHGKPIGWTTSATHIGLTGGAYGVLAFWSPDGRAAMTAVFLCLSCVMVQVIRELWATPDHGRLASRYIVGLGFYAFLLLFVASMIIAAVDPTLIADPSNAFYSLVADQTLSIMIYIGLLAMVGERTFARLERQAVTDPLTGVVNRRGLGQLLRRSRRTRPAGVPTVSVLICDIDHFKAINDRHGHDAGDAVLREFARRLSTVFRRKSDIVARWGGEEFVVILNDTPLKEAARLSEQFRGLVATEPFTIASGTIGLTVSVGVTAVGRDEPGIDAAIRRADTALYAAKNDGRNRVRIDEALTDNSGEKAS